MHVGEDGPACFKPSGLAVLPELARACDGIKAELQNEIDLATAQITNVAAGWTVDQTTTVGKLLRELSASTKPVSVEALATFTSANEKRLADLIAMISNDPKQRAAETLAAA